VGSNPVSWLIPCHRVIRSTVELGGYAWGIERKKIMLMKEQMAPGPRRIARTPFPTTDNRRPKTVNAL
jgi:hypothetical protein